MTPEAWGTNLGALAAALVAAQQAYKARQEGKKAADRSLPTSNGFAKKVLDSNARQESRMDDFGRRLVRIEDRLDAHLDRNDH
jgi:hypothetical protein